MAHVGWGTEPFGSLNCRNGAYDSAHYFSVTVGIPVWFSYRGCFHVEPIRPDKSPETAARLQDFADRYLGTTIGGVRLQLRELSIPLRDRPALKRMMLFCWFLWIRGLMALMAVIATSAIVPRGVVANDIPWLIAFWTGFALFVPGIVYYHYLRRARGRSARIREIVADRLGPFTDPADWDPALSMLVLANFGATDFSSDALQRDARKLVEERRIIDALIVARLGLSMLNDSKALEDVTDECLRH